MVNLNRIKIFGSRILLFLCFFLVPSFSNSAGVPAAPNEVIVEGTVVELCMSSSSLYAISPEQILYRLTVSVEATEDVEKFPNFVRKKEGQSLVFFSKVRPSQDVIFKKIRARVKYTGDERGGRFWIIEIEKIY